MKVKLKDKICYNCPQTAEYKVVVTRVNQEHPMMCLFTCARCLPFENIRENIKPIPGK